MKKKHRDIVVNDVQYGWTVDYRRVKIWKDKKVIAEHDVSENHDITPSIVAALIKEGKDALLWINSLPCPFCGALVKPSNDTQFFVCEHTAECWLSTVHAPTLIPKNRIETWDTRTW